jgi:hypothetical protein
MARTAVQKVYVVQKLHWRFTDRSDPLVLDPGPPGTPVKAFVDRDRATAFSRGRNRRKRANENPFDYWPEPPDESGSYLDQYATMGEESFLTLLGSESLKPPAIDPDKPWGGGWEEDWAEWWEEHRRGWDNRLAGRLWDALDRVRFYEVVEVVLER